MENKLYETGSVVGIEPATSRAQGKQSPEAEGKEPTRSRTGLIWTDPEGSMELVRRLMDEVNSQEEYEELERDLAELEALCPSGSNSVKGGAAPKQVHKMKHIVTIKGQPVIDIYESFDGSYWFATEKAWKQDSLIRGKIYKNDQIFFGYVKLSSCPQFAEFGYFSEAELKQLGNWVWKVPRRNWVVCPEVEVEEVVDQPGRVEADGCGISVPQPSVTRICGQTTGR